MEQKTMYELFQYDLLQHVREASSVRPQISGALMNDLERAFRMCSGDDQAALVEAIAAHPALRKVCRTFIRQSRASQVQAVLLDKVMQSDEQLSFWALDVIQGFKTRAKDLYPALSNLLMGEPLRECYVLRTLLNIAPVQAQSMALHRLEHYLSRATDSYLYETAAGDVLHFLEQRLKAGAVRGSDLLTLSSLVRRALRHSKRSVQEKALAVALSLPKSDLWRQLLPLLAHKPAYSLNNFKDAGRLLGQSLPIDQAEQVIVLYKPNPAVELNFEEGRRCQAVCYALAELARRGHQLSLKRLWALLDAGQQAFEYASRALSKLPASELDVSGQAHPYLVHMSQYLELLLPEWHAGHGAFEAGLDCLAMWAIQLFPLAGPALGSVEDRLLLRGIFEMAPALLPGYERSNLPKALQCVRQETVHV